MWSLIHPLSFAAHLQPFPLLSVLTAQQPTVSFFLHCTPPGSILCSLFCHSCSPPFDPVNRAVFCSSALLCLHPCILKVVEPHAQEVSSEVMERGHGQLSVGCCQVEFEAVDARSSGLVKEDGKSFTFCEILSFSIIFSLCKEKLRNRK